MVALLVAQREGKDVVQTGAVELVRALLGAELGQQGRQSREEGAVSGGEALGEKRVEWAERTNNTVSCLKYAAQTASSVLVCVGRGQREREPSPSSGPAPELCTRARLVHSKSSTGTTGSGRALRSMSSRLAAA